MWIHLPPSITSACALERTDWDSDLKLRAEMLSVSATSRSKHIAAKSWLRAWKRANWLKLLFSRIYEPSTASRDVESWIASLRATRASHSVSPENVVARMTEGTFGQMSGECLKKLAHQSFLAKTSLDTYRSDLSKLSTTWKDWVTRLRAACLQRRKLVAATSANDCLSWPSPRATTADRTSGDTGSKKRLMEGANAGLNDAVAIWATPATRDYKSGEASQETTERNARPLSEQDLLAQGIWVSPNCRDADKWHHLEAGCGRQQNLSGQTYHFHHPDPMTETDGGSLLADGQNSHQQWATPNSMAGGSASRSGARIDELLLAGQAQVLADAMWTSPRADSRDNCGGSNARKAAIKRGGYVGRNLNPLFVDWLMGLIPGWNTVSMPCGREEMELYLLSQRIHLFRCLQRLAEASRDKSGQRTLLDD